MSAEQITRPERVTGAMEPEAIRERVRRQRTQALERERAYLRKLAKPADDELGEHRYFHEWSRHR